MGAGLNQSAGFNHTDPIGIDDGGEPVRHHQGGAMLHQAVERFLNQLL